MSWAVVTPKAESANQLLALVCGPGDSALRQPVTRFSDDQLAAFARPFGIDERRRDRILALHVLKQMVDACREELSGRLAVVCAYQDSFELESAVEGYCQGTRVIGGQVAGDEELFSEIGQMVGRTPLALSLNAACASGNYCLAGASELLGADVADSVIVVCACAIQRAVPLAFEALGLLSASTCRPFARERDGVVLSEGAAALLLKRNVECPPGSIQMAGCGLTNDAYHPLIPEPSGREIRRAMELALSRAGRDVRGINYVNAHGTGTSRNDAVEAAAIQSLLGGQYIVGSTKRYTGHCLLAASAVEAVVCCEILASQRLPIDSYLASGSDCLDPAHVRAVDGPVFLDSVLSNSFGFGGANASVVFARSR